MILLASLRNGREGDGLTVDQDLSADRVALPLSSDLAECTGGSLQVQEESFPWGGPVEDRFPADVLTPPGPGVAHELHVSAATSGVQRPDANVVVHSFVTAANQEQGKQDVAHAYSVRRARTASQDERPFSGVHA